MPRSFALLVVLLTGLLAGSAALASELSLASDGTVLRLDGGRYGELFPDEGLLPPDASVLVLDVLHNNGVRERHLVPGSEDVSAELSARLVYEASGQTAYVLWEGLASGLFPVVFLTSFDGASWADLTEIYFDAFVRRGGLDLWVTRDNEADGTVRTIVHVVWSQDRNADGVSNKLYGQVILENGQRLGWTPLALLSDLAPTGFESAGGTADAGIAQALRLQAGRDDQSVVVGFLDPETRRLRVLEATVLAPALTDLAEKARGYIIDIGVMAKSHQELADSVAAFLYEAGAGFHVATLDHFVGQITAYLLGCGLPLSPAGLGEMGDKARGYIIDIGAKIGQAGVSSLGATTFFAVGDEPGDATFRHLTRVTLVGDFPAPAVGGAASLYLSQSGKSAIVAWDDETRVSYRETVGGGWTATSFVELGPSLDREAIHRMLADRVRGH